MFDYIAYGFGFCILAMLMWIDTTFCIGLFVSFVGSNGMLAINCANRYLL